MLQWFQAATGLPAVSWPSIILADDKDEGVTEFYSIGQ